MRRPRKFLFFVLLFGAGLGLGRALFTPSAQAVATADQLLALLDRCRVSLAQDIEVEKTGLVPLHIPPLAGDKSHIGWAVADGRFYIRSYEKRPPARACMIRYAPDALILNQRERSALINAFETRKQDDISTGHYVDRPVTPIPELTQIAYDTSEQTEHGCTLVTVLALWENDMGAGAPLGISELPRAGCRGKT